MTSTNMLTQKKEKDTTSANTTHQKKKKNWLQQIFYVWHIGLISELSNCLCSPDVDVSITDSETCAWL